MSTNVIQFPGRVPQWTFADRLRKARRDVNLTIKEMAELLGIGDQRYAAWETGRNMPPNVAEIAVKLERATGIARTWFLGWADESPRPDGPGEGFELPHLDSNQEPIGFPQWRTAA